MAGEEGERDADVINCYQQKRGCGRERGERATGTAQMRRTNREEKWTEV